MTTRHESEMHRQRRELFATLQLIRDTASDHDLKPDYRLETILNIVDLAERLYRPPKRGKPFGAKYSGLRSK